MAYNYEMRPGESLQGYYKRIAKVADQRLVRLEQYAAQGHKDVLEWSYKRAQRDIAQWSGDKAKRFNTKPPENINQLRAKINDIKEFLGADTSTKGKIGQVYSKRVSSLNSNYGTNYQVDDLKSLFSDSLWKKMEAKSYDSDTIMKAIGYIQEKATSEDILKGLQKQARQRKETPTFTGDPFIDKAVQDMLRQRTTIDKMYQYFKGTGI